MTMTAEEHWQAWLERWGDAYSTDEERRSAYRDFKANLARLSEPPTTTVAATSRSRDDPGLRSRDVCAQYELRTVSDLEI